MRRLVFTAEDLIHFAQSDTYRSLTQFIFSCSDAVRGVAISQRVYESEQVQCLMNILARIDEIIQLAPPIPGMGRFGNPAFRTFYDILGQRVLELMSPLCEHSDVSAYLCRSFGDRRRIDYGTGHEANFICFLLCLHKIGILKDVDLPALVLRVFVRYIKLARSLQQTYWLEPAGSHGVWGLDDYHSLPFLFGASQLIAHRFIRPRSIHSNDIVDEYANEYMYLDCIRAINAVKSVGLRWHSPMLDDISGIKSWDIVEAGMRRLYTGEVLGKLPIMQHFLFGSILMFENLSGKTVLDEAEESLDGHTHIYAMGQEFPTCCGMRVPSAYAAPRRDELRKPLPFD